MNKYTKIGLITMGAWILFLVLLYGTFAIVTNASLS